MNKTLKTVVIVVLAIAFAVFVLPRIILWIVFGFIDKSPKTPLSYMGSVWACEEPYMCFEVCHDEWGIIGIGELETADGERMPVRFDLGWNSCDIYRESAFWEIGEDGEPHITGPLEDPILECSYELRKKNTVLTLYVSPDNELYHDKYASFTFYRQDPAGTGKSAAQP